MRVAVSVPAFLAASDFGGPVAKVALLAEGLAARGLDVTVLTADYGPNRSRVPAKTFTDRGYTTHYLRTIARYRWSPVIAPGELGRLEWDFDVVHICGVREGLGLGVARQARRRGIPFVVEPLGMAKAHLRNAALKRLFDRAVTGRQLAGAATVIATSDAERGHLAQRYGLARIEVRPNPVVASTTTPAAKVPNGDGTIDVLFVGRICRTKNLLALVDAVHPLDDVRLTIAGPDDNDGTSAALRKAAAALPPGRVEFRDWVSADERDALIAAADICVLPSITENFGNYAVEAARGMRPLVVTTATGVAEFLGDTALVVDPTADALRAAIEKLAADPALRDDLAAAGYRRVAELHPGDVAAAQEQIYRDVLAGLV